MYMYMYYTSTPQLKTRIHNNYRTHTVQAYATMNFNTRIKEVNTTTGTTHNSMNTQLYMYNNIFIVTSCTCTCIIRVVAIQDRD